MKNIKNSAHHLNAHSVLQASRLSFDRFFDVLSAIFNDVETNSFDVSKTQSKEKQREELEKRLAQKITARLSEGANELPHDISERLRIARAQALAKRKSEPLMITSISIASSPSPSRVSKRLKPENFDFWARLASVFPVLALILGLLFIHHLQENAKTTELAEVDSALLTDDLPPNAYADPGFVQFLKSNETAVQPIQTNKTSETMNSEHLLNSIESNQESLQPTSEEINRLNDLNAQTSDRLNPSNNVGNASDSVRLASDL